MWWLACNSTSQKVKTGDFWSKLASQTSCIIGFWVYLTLPQRRFPDVNFQPPTRVHFPQQMNEHTSITYRRKNIKVLCPFQCCPGSPSFRACFLFVCLFFPRDLFILCMWVHCHCLQTHQKRTSDSITDGCELSCGCWELNSGPLEEQSVLLTAEPSLQPLPSFFIPTLYIHTYTSCV